MKLIPYKCDSVAIKNHYCNQTGHGIPNVYRAGHLIQRGYGLGNILSGLVRQALPILKKTVLPYVAKAAFKSGAEIVDNVTSGKSLKKSLISAGRKRIGELLTNRNSAPQTKKRKHRVTSKKPYF